MAQYGDYGENVGEEQRVGSTYPLIIEYYQVH